eukprot:GFYU01036116.1.p1 GENE.GFYU01036116.1~~GFYU01036116.1.p1  ORF type:complete len:199 (-),score=40.77 GFYU01036116.1:6-602(-)
MPIVEQVYQALVASDGMLVVAGKELSGADGLEDFADTRVLWERFRNLKDYSYQWSDVNNPEFFNKEPEFAWEFWKTVFTICMKPSRLDIYEGYPMFLEQLEQKYYVFTTNIDGRFLRHPFDKDRIVEYNGNISVWQCVDSCSKKSYVDTAKYGYKISKKIGCPVCGRAPLRPAIRMGHYDDRWIFKDRFELRLDSCRR